jgi:hypothetical protein
MSMFVPGLGADLALCLRHAAMSEDDLARCVAAPPRTFAAPHFSGPNGHAALVRVIDAIIQFDQWTLDDRLLERFLQCCHDCLPRAGSAALNRLTLRIVHAALTAFGDEHSDESGNPYRLDVTLNPASPMDEPDDPDAPDDS